MSPRRPVELNPYEWCCANKIIDGNQCTIVWHIDDLKISHVDPNVVTAVIADIQKEYGKTDTVTFTHGKVHNYLGMKIDFSAPEKVEITMNDSIFDILDDTPDDMIGGAVTPAGAHFFQVNEEGPISICYKAELEFHQIVAILLFLCKRARPDLQTAAALICTRVQKPDTDDYKKLSRTLKYSYATVGLPLILGMDGTNTVSWWVYGVFAIHNNMKSHTGSYMSLGIGAAYASSPKQKLNTRSSTKAELVAADDSMPQIVWTRCFLEDQGYGINDSIFYQDNQSDMLLEKNVRAYSSKRTRHINVRFFSSPTAFRLENST